MSFLRVMTLNIWSQQGPWPRRKELLVAELQTQAADVVALQEVLSFTPVPAPGLDAPPPPFPTQADELRADLYPYSAFAPACPVDARRTLGNALLSRFPIVQQSAVPLPNAVGPGHEPRVLLCALLELTQGLLPVFVTHLDWQLHLSHARCQQVRFIADHIDAYVAAARQLGRGLLPPILAGDLNAEPDSDEVRFLTGRHALPGPRGEPLRGAYFNDCYARAADPADFAARAVEAEPPPRLATVGPRLRAVTPLPPRRTSQTAASTICLWVCPTSRDADGPFAAGVAVATGLLTRRSIAPGS